MRNRAKCKLCNSIIESFHSEDYVMCKCTAISLYGGDAMRCAANDWKDFVRVDDQDNEIIVTVKESVLSAHIQSEQVLDKIKPDKNELLKMLDEMIKNIENLPSNALSSPITHYDLASALLLLSSIFRAES